jgi:hypothetical protein
MAKIDGISVRIVHPLAVTAAALQARDKDGDAPSDTPQWRPTNFTVIDRLPCTIKITQVKDGSCA